MSNLTKLATKFGFIQPTAPNVQRTDSGPLGNGNNSPPSPSSSGDLDKVKLPAVPIKANAAEVGDFDSTRFALAPNGTLVSLNGDSKELITAAPAAGIPQRGGRVWNRDDWLKIPEEGWGSYAFRLTFEGHTVFDAFLTAACGQIGQVMLTSPAAMYKAGIISGGIPMIWASLVGFWTVWNYVSLYLEYKRDKIKDGTWWDSNGERRWVSQWFEVAGHHLGGWAKYFVWIIMVISISGTCMVQTVASANSMYTIDPSRSKREWELIFGGSMVFLVCVFPRFTKFRLLNIIGIAGTFMATVYALDTAAKKGVMDYSKLQLYPPDSITKPGTTPVQNWFNGVAILQGEVGGHSFIIESMEAMEQPAHYKKAYYGGIIYIMFVVVPHTVFLNFVYGAKQMNGAENMYALFPYSKVKVGSIYLMIIHQYIAYLLYGTAACIALEKVVGVHTRPMWQRALFRLPIAAFWWFLALVLPFYGTINSLFSSLGGAITSYALLALASMWVYRKKERRDNAVFAPYKWLQWRGWTIPYIINTFIMLYYLGFSGVSFYYAIVAIKGQYKTWGFMPECYLCPAPAKPAVIATPALNTTLAANATIALVNGTRQLLELAGVLN